ncbi:hypothetical protein [Catellatospora sp. NPDC049609]|uniref:hypothetical protein n=1 Tax=Catellatospora sp. NPDC049609 TaxID=3155505 RepID=UPI00342A6B68
MHAMLVLVLVIGLVLLLAVAVNRRELSRQERFAQRHQLEPTPATLAAVTAYLAATRRFRVVGTLAGGTAGLLVQLSWQQVRLDLTALLAGWLVGAYLAEASLARDAESVAARHATAGNAAARAAGAAGGAASPAGTDTVGAAPPAVPRWLRAVPVITTVTAGLVTTLHLWTRFEAAADAVAWGLGAVAASGLAALTVRTVSQRPRLAGADPAVDRAARAHAAAGVTAVGMLLAAHCLLRPLADVQAGRTGQTLAAVAGAGSLWLVGSLLLAVAIWSAAAPGGRVRLPAVLTAGLAVVTVAWLGVGVVRDIPPYGPGEVQAVAQVRFTGPATHRADAAAFGMPWATGLVAGDGEQAFLGRVELRLPPGAPRDGDYHVLVIDNRSNTVPPIYGEQGAGWNGFLDTAADRYPWLAGVFGRTGPDGVVRDSPMAVYAKPGQPEAITFEGVVPAGAMPSHLAVVLIFSGPQQQIYWATRLPVSPA